MKEKIVHLMKSEGLSSSRLAEILETQPSRISHIVSGRNKPSFDLLQTILRRFPKINPDWLLLDSAQMYRNEQEAPLPRPVADDSRLPLDIFDLGGVSLADQVARESQNMGGQSGAPVANFSAENRGEDPANFPRNFASKSSSVERIIILYSDGTFSTYNGR